MWAAGRYGVEEPYEKLKAFTRGQKVTAHSMQVRSKIFMCDLLHGDSAQHAGEKQDFYV